MANRHRAAAYPFVTAARCQVYLRSAVPTTVPAQPTLPAQERDGEEAASFIAAKTVPIPPRTKGAQVIGVIGSAAMRPDHGRRSVRRTSPGMLGSLATLSSTPVSSVMRGRLVLGIVAVLVAVAGFIWWSRKENPVAGAKRMIGYALAGDAEGLLSYARDDEIRQLGLTEGKVSKLLRNVVLPRIEGFRPKGDVLIQEWSDRRLAGVSQRFAHPDGREFSIFFVLGPTSRGLQATELVPNLVFAAIDASWPPDKPRPKGAAKAEFYANSLTAALADLEATGIEGIIYDNEIVRKRMSWREVIAGKRASVARMEKAAKDSTLKQ